MRAKQSIGRWLVALFLIASEIALAQDPNQNCTLIINGQSTQVPVIQVNGRSYVGLEALASVVNGSLSFAGSQIALSIPLASTMSAPVSTSVKPASAPTPASNPGFSKGFLNAGIEEAATLREWHTALASAIQNGRAQPDRSAL